jgi:hypothetical protein
MFTREMLLNWLFEEGLAEISRSWAECVKVNYSDEDKTTFYAVILDNEDEDKEYVINVATIRRGIRVGFENRSKLGDPYQRQAFSDLNFGKWDDVDYDAFTADYLIQFALFGDVVYS